MKTRKRKDPLTQVQRVSDAFRFSWFEKDGKRIVFLGDIHIPNIETCRDCTPPECLSYKTILRELLQYHNKKAELDIYFEGFAPSIPHNVLEKIGIYAKHKLSKLTRKITKQSIRLETNVRNSLYPLAFMHSKSNIRVHSIDIRLTHFFLAQGFNLQLFLSKESYRKQLHDNYTPETLKIKILHMIFDTNSPIRKQYSKLEEDIQQIVKKWIDKHIVTLLELNDPILHAIVFLTDVYGICRMIRYFQRQSKGSTTILFAGAFHTWNYGSFFRYWGVKTIVNTHEAALSNLEKEVETIQDSVPVCIELT